MQRMQGRTETAEEKRWVETAEAYGDKEIEAFSPLFQHIQREVTGE